MKRLSWVWKRRDMSMYTGSLLPFGASSHSSRRSPGRLTCRAMSASPIRPSSAASWPSTTLSRAVAHWLTESLPAAPAAPANCPGEVAVGQGRHQAFELCRPQAGHRLNEPVVERRGRAVAIVTANLIARSGRQAESEAQPALPPVLAGHFVRRVEGAEIDLAVLAKDLRTGTAAASSSSVATLDRIDRIAWRIIDELLRAYPIAAGVGDLDGGSRW